MDMTYTWTAFTTMWCEVQTTQSSETITLSKQVTHREKSAPTSAIGVLHCTDSIAVQNNTTTISILGLASTPHIHHFSTVIPMSIAAPLYTKQHAIPQRSEKLMSQQRRTDGWQWPTHFHTCVYRKVAKLQLKAEAQSHVTSNWTVQEEVSQTSPAAHSWSASAHTKKELEPPVLQRGSVYQRLATSGSGSSRPLPEQWGLSGAGQQIQEGGRTVTWPMAHYPIAVLGRTTEDPAQNSVCS